MSRAVQDMGDRGSITPYGIIFISIVMLFIGLAVDGGAKLQAGWEAVGVAEEAARAGAGQIDRAAVYAGARQITVDRAAAVQAAQAYLAKSGHTGTVTPAGPRSIRVTVSVTRPTWVLSMVGIPSVSQTASSTADLVVGIGGEHR